MVLRVVAFIAVPLAIVACETSAPGSEAVGADAGAEAAASPRAPAADPVSWRKTGSLQTARYAHTASLLPDGRVLVVGGEDAGQAMTAAVETFDPGTEQWTAAPSLPEPRSNHVAVALQDGKVLVAGGGKNAPIGQPLGESVAASALLFDPLTNTFTATGRMHHARSHFHAVRLPSGEVLAVGGGGDEQESAKKCAGQYCGPFGKALASAEVYDPKTGEWTEVASMTTPRFSFSLTALPSGKVIAVGGVNEQAEGFATSEIFDPISKTWSDGPPLATPRQHHTATLLGTGRVMVAGGKNPNVSPLNTVQLFDPEGVSWKIARKFPTPRTLPGLATLESGRVLVVGGYDQTADGAIASEPYIDEAEIYDDESKTWTTVGALTTGRFWHTMTVLTDGRILVAGGRGEGGELASCEIAEP